MKMNQPIKENKLSLFVSIARQVDMESGMLDEATTKLTRRFDTLIGCKSQDQSSSDALTAEAPPIPNDKVLLHESIERLSNKVANCISEMARLGDIIE